MPGNKVVYVKQPDYVPRKEPPSGAAGGKRAWSTASSGCYIPDRATAGAALEAGEVDFWENVPPDFAPRLEKNANITVVSHRPAWARRASCGSNHLHPPFNNEKARQALLTPCDQKNYLRRVIGNAEVLQGLPGRLHVRRARYETGGGARADKPRPREGASSCSRKSATRASRS